MMKVKKSVHKKTPLTTLVIGDPHFKHNNLDEMRDFVEKTISIAEKYKPTFIVILGDTLDTHEIIRIEPKDMAENWIYTLSAISETFLLIGNHDMANPNEFMTRKHAFNSLKRWEIALKGKLHVIDEPFSKEIKNKSFVFCPYTPKGKFKDALDMLCGKGMTWDLADCIFAHQEFKGSRQGAYEIQDGDEWDDDYPPIINGHIHNEQKIGTNIFIPGTPYQQSFGETADKYIWLLTFEENDDDDYPGFVIDKINLGMRVKKTVAINIDDIHSFKKSLLKKYDVKIKIEGTYDQFKVFKTTEEYKDLSSNKNLKLEFVDKKDNVEEISLETIPVPCRNQVSYLSILHKIVNGKSEPVKEMYREIVGDVEEKVEYDIIFEDEEEYTSDSD